MERMERTFFSHPSDLALLDHLRRWIQHGETRPWIHHANVYGDEPSALTSRYARATDADGDTAWYFFCTPSKKSEKDSRFRRTAGEGTWKEERGRALVAVAPDGSHETVGWRQTFTFMLKSRPQDVSRMGWIQLEVKMADGSDLCLCKIYRTPRKGGQGRALVLAPPPPMGSAPPPPPAAATAAVTLSTAAPPPSTAAPPPSAAAPPPSAAAPPPSAAAPPPSAAAPPPSAAAPPLSAAAPPPSTAAPPPSTAAPPRSTVAPPPSTAAPPPSAAAPPQSTSSPPRKLVVLEISGSPIRSSDRGSAKRVFQAMDLPVEALKDKKLRICKGWFTLDANQEVI